MQKLRTGLLIAWGVVLVAGAMGALLDIEMLRTWTDLKSIFLR